MTSSLQIPYLVASSIRSRKGSNASSLDEAFGTYTTYGIKSEWANFSSGPQPNNENADSLEYRALYNNCVEITTQRTTTRLGCPDQEDTAFNHWANLDASSRSPLKESSEALIQQGASNFGKNPPQKNFVRKLYEMLDDKSSQKYIRWNPDGKSFIIENQDDFAKNVLGRYLKTGNFQSFIRQLNMYDFHKTNKAQRPQRGVQAQAQQFVFSHSKFQKDKPELLSEIKRKGTEQQDPPPYQETMAARIGPSPVQAQLPLALKASLRAGTSVPMPQVQNEPSSTALTAHSTFLDGNTSNQSFDLTHHGNLPESNYMESPLKPVEWPVVFPQYPGVTVERTSKSSESVADLTGILSHVSLESTPLSGPLTSPPSPNIIKTRQRTPGQSRHKERPTLWDEWLVGHLPLGKSQDEAGPPNVNAFSHATHNANYGKAHLGGRAQPITRVTGYRT